MSAHQSQLQYHRDIVLPIGQNMDNIREPGFYVVTDPKYYTSGSTEATLFTGTFHVDVRAGSSLPSALQIIQFFKNRDTSQTSWQRIYDGSTANWPAATIFGSATPVYTRVDLPNFASSGSAGTASATVDGASILTFTQTTGSIVVSLPDPTTPTTHKIITLENLNASTQPITVTGAASGSDSIVLAVNEVRQIAWNGTRWKTILSTTATPPVKVDLSNFASNGSIGAAGATVDIAAIITFTQTTAGVSVTVPTPTTTTTHRTVTFENLPASTQSITVSGAASNSDVLVMAPGDVRELTWNGSAWKQNEMNYRRVDLSNFASSGSAGSASTTTDIATVLTFTQTTQNISVTLASPTVTTIHKVILLENLPASTRSIIVTGAAASSEPIQLAVGESRYYVWNGSFWKGTVAKEARVTFADFASNGSIGTAAVTVDVASSIAFVQTTGNISVTVPAPTTSAPKTIVLENITASSQPITVSDATAGGFSIELSPGAVAVIYWNGNNWKIAEDVYRRVALSDIAVSGSIGTAASTVDVATVLTFTQTTPTVVMDLPTPTRSAIRRSILLESSTSSTVQFAINTSGTSTDQISMNPGDIREVVWNGSIWKLVNVDGYTNVKRVDLSNFASGSAIGTAQATVDIASIITFNQTTSNITVTIPSPSMSFRHRPLILENLPASTQAIVISAGDVFTFYPGDIAVLYWNGTSWRREVAQARRVDLSNFASNGSIGTAAATTAIAAVLTFNQTTANISVTIADPTPSLHRWIMFESLTTSTQPINISGAASGSAATTLYPGESVWANWNGTIWTFVGGSPRQVAVANMASGGTIVQDYTDNVETIIFTQTTASQTISLGTPTYATRYRAITVIGSTSGSANIRLTGGGTSDTIDLGPRDVRRMVWNGAGWKALGQAPSLVSVANLASSGNILTAATSVDIADVLEFNQTTASITATLLAPTGGGRVNRQAITLSAVNSTQALTIANASGPIMTLYPLDVKRVFYDGANWRPVNALSTRVVLSNFASNGSIGTAAATIDYTESINFTQTTSGITVTLPDPTVTSQPRTITLTNSSSATNSLVVSGAASGSDSVLLAVGSSRTLRWIGDKWVSPTATQSEVLIITASGTTTIPPWCKYFDVNVINGSSGGGSGRRGAAGTARFGGGGSAAGATTSGRVLVSDLTSNILTITIGAGGAGGAAVTTDDTDGDPGSVGGTSSIVCNGASVFRAIVSGAVPLGGSATAGTAGGVSTGAPTSGNGGGNGSSGTGGNGVATTRGDGAGGGGGGGGINTGNSISAGGVGGQGFTVGGPNRSAVGGTAGTASGGNGGNGNAKGWERGTGGGGAGGGAGSAAPGAGGTGGDGGIPGGGAGGGGASTNGANSGAGGAGARGEVQIIYYS